MKRKVVVYPQVPISLINSLNAEYERDIRKNGKDPDCVKGMSDSLVIYGIAGSGSSDGIEVAVYQTKTQRVFRDTDEWNNNG